VFDKAPHTQNVWLCVSVYWVLNLCFCLSYTAKGDLWVPAASFDEDIHAFMRHCPKLVNLKFRNGVSRSHCFKLCYVTLCVQRVGAKGTESFNEWSKILFGLSRYEALETVSMGTYLPCSILPCISDSVASRFTGLSVYIYGADSDEFHLRRMLFQCPTLKKLFFIGSYSKLAHALDDRMLQPVLKTVHTFELSNMPDKDAPISDDLALLILKAFPSLRRVKAPSILPYARSLMRQRSIKFSVLV